MNPVWMIRGRQLATRLRFWTAIVGYDPHDHTLSHRIYLVYITIFFSIWGFAVLTLMADVGTLILSLFPQMLPVQASIMLVSAILVIDFLMRGYRYTRHSPFIFSEEDAELICQTPLNRRQIALAWMAGDWIPKVLPYLVLAVILRFAAIQYREGAYVQWNRLPRYLLAGLQVTIIISLIHLALEAIINGIGSLRLRGDRDKPALRMIPIGVAAILISSFLLNKQTLQLLLWPLLYVVTSSFGGTSWIIGFFVAMIYAFLGIFTLYLLSSGLNLSRAAQESISRWNYQQVSWLGDARLNRQLQLRERLGTGHTSSTVQVRAGIWALIWRNWVIALRSTRIDQIVKWIGIFVSGLAMIIAPGWGVRIWSFIFWTVLIGQGCTHRLQYNLEIWSINRQLPFSAEKIILSDLALPIFGSVLLSWLAYASSYWMGFNPPVLIIGMIPGLVLGISMFCANDILRHSRGSELVVGRTASLGASGLLLSVLFSGLPISLILWMRNQLIENKVYWLTSLLSFFFSYGVAFLLWKLSANTYRAVK